MPDLTPEQEVDVAGAKASWGNSNHHDFTPEQNAEYDSLRARGRTLYDMLRTYYAWSHDLAFEVARQEYGTKEQ